jgi:hypothetical protein
MTGIAMSGVEAVKVMYSSILLVQHMYYLGVNLATMAKSRVYCLRIV